MSTEEKKAAYSSEALSGQEMADTAGGKPGKPGGPDYLNDDISEALSGKDMAGIAGGKSGKHGGPDYKPSKLAALSEDEMFGVAGGTSSSGKSGGPSFLVDSF